MLHGSAGSHKFVADEDPVAEIEHRQAEADEHRPRKEVGRPHQPFFESLFHLTSPLTAISSGEDPPA